MTLPSKKQYRLIRALLKLNNSDIKIHKQNKAGTGVLVFNNKNKILAGLGLDNLYNFPGGNVEDGEDFKKAAIRELEEETGLKLSADSLKEIPSDNEKEKSFYIQLNHSPEVKDTDELKNVKFYDLNHLPFSRIRPCCKKSLISYQSILDKSKKSIYEKLEKNMSRHADVFGAVHEMNHGDTLRLIGSNLFKFIKDSVSGMLNDTIRKISLDQYFIHIRKHANDLYSGRVDDGTHTIYSFVGRSLPILTAELMSIFEYYYAPDEEPDFIPHENGATTQFPVEEGFGLQALADNYKNYNLSDIYDEMENLREEIRNGVVVDLQQVENKIFNLFNKLDEVIKEISSKYNEFNSDVGDEIDFLHSKIQELQLKLNSLIEQNNQKEISISTQRNPDVVYGKLYNYLPKPNITINPDGTINIKFTEEWNNIDQLDFLKSIRARMTKSK